jgi:hypothetical protein
MQVGASATGRQRRRSSGRRNRRRRRIGIDHRSMRLCRHSICRCGDAATACRIRQRRAQVCAGTARGQSRGSGRLRLRNACHSRRHSICRLGIRICGVADWACGIRQRCAQVGASAARRQSRRCRGSRMRGRQRMGSRCRRHSLCGLGIGLAASARRIRQRSMQIGAGTARGEHRRSSGCRLRWRQCDGFGV